MLSDVLISLVTMSAITIVIAISLKYQVTDFKSERFLLSPTTYPMVKAAQSDVIAFAEV
jgi:hypothetical protein